MWTEFAQIVAAIVAAISLVFAIFTQVRMSSQRKYAERAETAARLLGALQGIGVGGISPRLDDLLALKLPDEQVHGLQEVIRINIAGFQRQSKRTGFPLELHFLVGLLGLLVLSLVPEFAGRVPLIEEGSQWAGVLVVTIVVLLGVTMFGGLVKTLVSRGTKRKVMRSAGIYVPSMLETFSAAYVGFRLWREQRSARRKR